MIDFNLLKTFLLISELRSLAAAARKLNISPAAVSKQVSRLEQDLGVQLLHRTTRKLELTEIGSDFLSQCRRILEEVELATEIISNTKRRPSGILKVMSSRHFARTYILPNLKEFLLKYPEIQLKLELAERIPDLAREGVDVLMGMSLSASGDIIQKRIATTSYLFCASPAYLDRYGTPEKPVDLKKHRYITHSMRPPDNELIFDDQDSVKLTPYLCVNDTETMLKCAEEGLGVVKLHDYVVKRSLKKGKLKQILASYTSFDIPIYVVYKQRRLVAPKIRCFIDFILSKMAS